MTIFHPGNKGVPIPVVNTLNITMNKPPVLQWCKEEDQKLWTKSTSEKEEEINNSYNLPSTIQRIRYFNAATGFRVESTWMQAIKAGNFVTWPRLTPKNSMETLPRI
jgi:hypothetical protein